MELQVCSVIDSLINNPKGQSIATCWGNQKKKIAKEIVRRWNAFEKDGLVDELKIACEKLMKAWLPTETRSMRQLDTDMNLAYQAAVAAIAKVKA